VFPPVDQGTPAPGPVQTPYHPGPYGTPTPAPAYGYPQQGGYQSPPQTAAYAGQHGPSTPPPYNLSPQPATGGPGGAKSNKPVVIGSVLVALIAVGGLITALVMNGGSGDDNKGGGHGTAGSSPSAVAGHKGPDTSKTIDTEKCTDPTESYNDPKKIEIPDFHFKNLSSVRSCFQAAGWQMKVTPVDENTYGEDTVMDQFPSAGTDVDPNKMPEIELKVSTGDPS
jgi:hypothetical protein